MNDLIFVAQNEGDDRIRDIQNGFVLRWSDWDDFGYRIAFDLFHYQDGEYLALGRVKILRRNSRATRSGNIDGTTRLPHRFSELSSDFISLGQTDSYYKQVQQRFGNRAGFVLVALRDIAWQPRLSEEFEPSSAFRNALLRVVSADRARRLGRSLALGEAPKESFSFVYNCTVPGFTNPITASIDLDGTDELPGRIVGIIGRNAVGKTQFLANLSEDLGRTIRRSERTSKDLEARFPDSKPLFNRVIAVSYGVFDKFKRPNPSPFVSYVYAGIRNPRGSVSLKYLSDSYEANRTRIVERGLESEWLFHIRQILGESSDAMLESLEHSPKNINTGRALLETMSSGQSILTHCVTALMAWVENHSLILFDEPETHLHPNGVALLFNVLTKILKNFDSYALIATHSPVVIQEIPAKRVLVFRRTNDTAIAEKLEIESFGESIAELTRHVFETNDIQTTYRTTLSRLAKQEPAEEVLARFEMGLSVSAQAFLLAQYAKKAQGS